MNYEQKYYENSDFWEADRYIENEGEKQRYLKCRSMIPDDVKNLCDIGSGNGAFLYFCEKSDKRIDLCGLERSKVARDKKVCSSELIDGDIQNLNFDDNRFDITTCMEVIEHLPIEIYETGLSELERISNKYILISVPFDEKRGLVECPYCSARFNQCYHLRSFDLEKLNQLFKKFKMINIQYIGEGKEVYSWFSGIIKLKNRIVKKRSMLEGGVCPQCGYTKPKNNKKLNIKNNRAKQIILNLFSKKKYRWVIALYQKEI